MNQVPDPTTATPPEVAVPEISVPSLIGQVYASAPPSLRARMLEHLTRPMGILGLMAIANGVFVGIRLRNASALPDSGLEDVSAIQPSDVVTLAAWAQQVSMDAIDGLTKLLAASPVLTKSATAAALLSLLIQRTKNRRDKSQTSPID